MYTTLEQFNRAFTPSLSVNVKGFWVMSFTYSDYSFEVRFNGDGRRTAVDLFYFDEGDCTELVSQEEFDERLRSGVEHEIPFDMANVIVFDHRFPHYKAVKEYVDACIVKWEMLRTIFFV